MSANVLLGINQGLCRVLADLAGLDAAVWVIAALTAASGLLVAVRMYETPSR